MTPPPKPRIGPDVRPPDVEADEADLAPEADKCGQTSEAGHLGEAVHLDDAGQARRDGDRRIGSRDSRRQGGVASPRTTPTPRKPTPRKTAPSP